MNAPHPHERDSAGSSDADADVGITLDAARRATLVERLRAVVEPSSSVDHLLDHLTGARPPDEMTVVDWTLPLARTDGGVALRVVRPDGATAYLGFVDPDFRATPWRTRADDRTADTAPADADPVPVAPREWFPEGATTVPIPVESTPLDG